MGCRTKSKQKLMLFSRQQRAVKVTKILEREEEPFLVLPITFSYFILFTTHITQVTITYLKPLQPNYLWEFRHFLILEKWYSIYILLSLHPQRIWASIPYQAHQFFYINIYEYPLQLWWTEIANSLSLI